MTQREKPQPAAAEAWIAKARAEGGYVSGGQLQAFREGWAMPIMGESERAHHFVRSELEHMAIAACGTKSLVRFLYAPGNFPKCQRCQRKKGTPV